MGLDIYIFAEEYYIPLRKGETKSMKKYVINAPDADARVMLTQADSLLAQVEVKGDSVLSMYQARSLLQSLWQLLQPVEETQVEKEGGNDLP